MIDSTAEYNWIAGDINDVIVNGEVMPLRSNSQTGTDSKNCLRGEDICFLGEATQQRVGGCLSGGQLFSVPLSGAEPLSFTKRLDRQQLNNFLAEYRPLSADGFFYKNGLSAGIGYFLESERPDHQVKQTDLILRDFPTDFSNMLEKQPLLDAFDDLKVLSCSAFKIDISAAVPPQSGQYFTYPPSYYGSNCTCPAATLDSPFVVKCYTKGSGPNDDYGPTYTALSGIVGYVNELTDVNSEVELWAKTTLKDSNDYISYGQPPGPLSTWTATGFIKLGDGQLQNGRFDLQLDGLGTEYTMYIVGSSNAVRLVNYRCQKEGLPLPGGVAIANPQYEYHFSLSCENTEYWLFCKHGDHTKWW